MIEKDEVYHEVLHRVTTHPESRSVFHSGRCLFYAFHTIEVLRERGVRAVVQAGSAGWPRIPPEQDDGKSTTHFSYMWSPDTPMSREAVSRGALPEIHVWAGLLESQEIIDFTTRYWVEQARTLGGFDWPGTPPPEFFWGHGRELNGAFYQSNREATEYAVATMAKVYGKERVKRILSPLETTKA